MTEAEQITAKLTEAQRAAWIRTVLVISHSDRQRHAFFAGYNGNSKPPHSSPEMTRDYELGLQVRAILKEQQP